MGITTPHDNTMSLDTYTRYIPLHKAANFWGNYVSALKGNADLCAAPEPRITHYYPSVTETLPPDANERINSLGYNYLPVHTEIYGSYRNRDARSVARFRTLLTFITILILIISF